MERGEYNHVDVMIGYTKDEGLLQSIQFEINPDLYGLAMVILCLVHKYSEASFNLIVDLGQSWSYVLVWQSWKL